MREVQNEILQNYKSDFAKHINPNDISKVRMLWDSIPAHLARDQEREAFKLFMLDTGGGAKKEQTTCIPFRFT